MTIDTSNSLLLDQIYRDEQLATDLISDDEKKEATDTAKRISNLLKEYIIAMTAGRPTDDIQGQIASVLDTYQKDLKHYHDLDAKVKDIVSHPDQNSLATLNQIIDELKNAQV